MATTGQGGKPAYVHSHQPREDFRFDVAENREAGGELLDGAVALAELHAGKRRGQGCLGLDGGGGCHEVVAAEGGRQGGGAVPDVRTGFFHFGRVAPFHVREPLLGERPYGVGAGHLLQLLEGKCCNVQVVIAQAGLALRAEDVAACGPAGTCSRLGNPLDLDNAGPGQVVEVAPDSGRGEPKHVPQLGRTDGTVFQDGSKDPVPGALVGVRHRTGRSGTRPGNRHSGSVGHGIHNTIMS